MHNDLVTLRVRSAVAEDAAGIGDLTVGAYIAGGHLSVDSPYQQTLRDVGGRLDATIVAESDGELLGSVTVMPAGHDFAEISRPGEWEFRFLAVSSARWGSGVGRTLVAAAEDRAKDAGAESMVLCVVDTNTRAQEFYTSLGYERLPERDWSPGDDGVSIRLLCFRRGLDTAAGR